MSHVDKLKISGVRSFCPDDNQIIRFSRPLTIIQGPNGSGKTTIIESLKYACCGEMPPGAKGAPFVHDPKLANESEVKAQVKLQFANSMTGKCVVSRSSQVSVKKGGKSEGKIEFKTLENVLNIYNTESGKCQSLSSKCVDVDKLMLTHLGVSKAVLTNVIFCHQEESNWPLGEGKQVKTKFDEIFDSTRYNKALENIKKVKKELDEELKLYQNDLKHLKDSKETAAKKKNELENEKIRLAATDDSITKYQVQLEPLDARRREIELRYDELHKLQTQLAQLSTEKEGKLKNIEETKTALTPAAIFPGDTAELETEIREFERKVDAKKKLVDDLTPRLKAYAAKIADGNKEKQKRLTDKGKYEQQVLQHKAKIEQRNALVAEKLKDYDVRGSESGVVDETTVRRFADALSEKVKAINDECDQRKKTMIEEEHQLQGVIDKKVQEKALLDSTVAVKTKSKEDCRHQLSLNRKKRTTLEASASQGGIIEREVALKQREVDDAKKLETEMLAKRAELKQALDAKKRAESTVRELQAEQKRAQRESVARSKLDSLRAEKESKAARIKGLLDEHCEELHALFKQGVPESLRDAVDEKQRTISQKVRELQSTMQALKVDSSRKEQGLQTISEQLRQKKQEVHDFEERLKQLCGSVDLDASLKSLEEAIASKHDEKSTFDGFDRLYKRFLDDSKRSRRCELCHRGFEQQAQFDDYLKRLGELLAKVPQRKEQLTVELEELADRQKKLFQLQASEAVVKKYRKEIDDLERKSTELTSGGDGVDELKRKMKVIQENLQLETANEQKARSIQADAGLVQSLKADTCELEAKIQVERSYLSDDAAAKTLDTINNEIDKLQLTIDELAVKTQHLQRHIQEHDERVLRLSTELNKLTQQKLDAQKGEQELHSVHAREQELEREISRLDEEIDQAHAGVPPVQKELDTLREQKEARVKRREEVLGEFLERAAVVESVLREMDAMNREVEGFRKSAVEERLQEVHVDLKRIDEDISTTELRMTEDNKRKEELREEIDSQKMRQRELQDNFKLRRWMMELEGVELKQTELRVKLAGFNAEELGQERTRLGVECGKISKSLNEAQGKVGEIKAMIRRIESDLDSDMLRNAEERYNERFVQVKTTDMAGKDLSKYHVALDKAIMQFHAMKMKEINKTIKELWQKIYKGSDIEYIEMKADEEQAATLEKKRNAVNYRVVMHTKNDQEMDMRGRCSAGQKVLASLLIRIALAETFSHSCGVLALDEPTTNLDRDNIEGLALALADIVKARAESQKNFQLICITHDSEFVEMLLNEGLADFYLHVEKDENGYSALTQKSKQE